MGLDLTLGGLVLLMGIRGWGKGFVAQAIQLAGVISCVYLADPVRDLVKPHVIGHLPSIHPDIVDRLLWWTSAVGSYVVVAGLAKLATKMFKRKALGEPEPRYNDQFAGFMLGGAKGLVVSALLLAAFEKYAIDRLKDFPWVEAQAKASRTLRWSGQYQPVPKVWATTPVQNFVNHIQRMGLKSPTEQEEGAEPVAAANQAPKLAIPPADPLGVDAMALDSEIAKKLESVKDQLRRIKAPEK